MNHPSVHGRKLKRKARYMNLAIPNGVLEWIINRLVVFTIFLNRVSRTKLIAVTVLVEFNFEFQCHLTSIGSFKIHCDIALAYF